MIKTFVILFSCPKNLTAKKCCKPRQTKPKESPNFENSVNSV
jgi:hypothetical protein